MDVGYFGKIAMNRFDHFFFSKYVPGGEEVRAVYHRHIVVIIDDVLVWLFFGVLLPTIFYLHDSFRIAQLVPLAYFEGFLLAVWAGLMWRVLDWYNDVWIVTDKSIVDLDWTPMKQNVVTLSFDNIEGIEAKEKTVIDNMINRGDVIVHCIGSQFVLDEAWAPGKIVSEIRAAAEARHIARNAQPLPAAPQANEFEMLVGALKDIVRERMDSKRVEAMEKESFRPQLEGALMRRGTIDLRPDDQKWERYRWDPAPAAAAENFPQEPAYPGDPGPAVDGSQQSLLDAPAAHGGGPEEVPMEPFPEESEEHRGR